MAAFLDGIKVLFKKKKHNINNEQDEEETIMQDMNFIETPAPENKQNIASRLLNMFKWKKSPAPTVEYMPHKAVTVKKSDKSTSAASGGKIAILCVLVVVLCGASYYVYGLFFQDSGGSGSGSVATKEVTHKNSKGKKTSKLSDNGNIPSIPPNPFTATKELPQLAVTDGIQNTKIVQQPKYVSVPQTAAPPVTRAETRPSIPVQSRVLPNVPKPAASPPSVTQNPLAPETPVNANSVQGIMSADDGTKIAIMGDGSVLSEGESFLDSSISFIDENGVVLDNGKTIKFELNE